LALRHRGRNWKLLRELAKLWKALVARSDEGLGIGGEYTRPAVKTFLEDFKEEVESQETRYKFLHDSHPRKSEDQSAGSGSAMLVMYF
jgi:hypothetical protein